MIVKILGNKGGGSAGAVIDYMLGKDKDREGAFLLSGDPDLTARIADSLDFQNRYTVGVLSFEELNISEEKKQEIMTDFEETLLAGLERDQYDITWIEHRDKGRLELNFIIPNVELSTGKRLQPYYDKVDRPLVENWKQKTNFEHGLSDPHAPEKAQAIKTLNSQNLPTSVKEIKEQIGLVIADQIGKGIIQDRKDVIQTLEQAGFEITRETDRSISIKNPDGKRNIRLEGTVYENRKFDQEFAEERNRAREDYQGASRERYATALGKLQSLVECKQQGNRERFKSQPKANSTRTTEDQKRAGFEYIYRVSAGYPDSITSIVNREQLVVRQKPNEQEAGTSHNQFGNRSKSARETYSEQSGISREQRQADLFHCSEEQQESGNLREHKRSEGFTNSKIKASSKSVFDNPFSAFDTPFNRDDSSEPRNLRDVEYLFDGLNKQTESSESHQKSKPSLGTKPEKLEQSHAKRLYESLQRITKLVGETVKRTANRKSVSERADRILEQSDSNIERTEQRIDQSKRTIEQSKSNIKQSEQQIERNKQHEVIKEAENKRARGGLSR